MTSATIRVLALAAVPVVVAAAVLTLAGSAADAKRKPSCHGKRATIVGTQGKDRLRGKRGRDVIAALGGADRIKRIDRKDTLCAGGGRDRVRSAPHPGRGGAPKDSTRAPGVPQKVTPAKVDPPAGTGYLVLGSGADHIRIDCDEDAPYPDGAYNQIEAGPGDDYVESDCPFHDSVGGGPGDDEILIGLGRDTALGAGGDDKIVDTFSIATDCEQNLPPVAFDIGLPDRRCVQFNTIGPFWYDFEDHWIGGEGDDRIRGGEANDLISGEEGDDRLRGGPGGDAVSGGPDADRCDGGDGTNDTNSGEGYQPLGDCETASGFEPFPEPQLPDRRRPNCSRELYPDSTALSNCLRSGPRLALLNWSPAELDVSEGPGAIDVEAWIIDGESPDLPVSPLGPLAEEMSRIAVEISSDGGASRAVDFPCSRPDGESFAFRCPGAIEFPQGAPSATWSLVTITLFDDSGRWSRYAAADLSDPELFLFPIHTTPARRTFVHGDVQEPDEPSAPTTSAE